MNNPTSLADWLALLERRHPKDIDLGLERVSQVYQRLDCGAPAPQVVSVGGTNGKGSCVAILATLLMRAGRCVATYTSPHLMTFNERVALNGQAVSEQQLCQAFVQVEAARGTVSLTYFEFTTLAALAIMAAAQVDVAILEVGLGGRLDAVNIVDADIAIITSIDLDHQEFLGDTRESVATEKLGIARAGRPLLCGEVNLPANFNDELNSIGAVAHFPVMADSVKDAIGDVVNLPAPSVVCALTAAELLGVQQNADTLAVLLNQVVIPGRFQRIPMGDRELILDVAHNPAAACLLASRLQGQGDCVGVLAMMADKDLAGVIHPLSEVIDHWLLPPLQNNPRAAQPSKLAQLLCDNGAEYTQVDDMATAIESGLTRVGAGGKVVVFGSFFTVASALQWLQGKDPVENKF